MAIVQWNIRGYRGNYHYLRKLLEDTNPVCVCLQETKINNVNVNCPNGMKLYQSVNDGNAHGGACVLIRSEIPHTLLDLQTNLQAVAVRLFIDKLYTVCSIYLPPN